MGCDEQSSSPEYEYLKKLAHTKMPYGKYAGYLLLDLPERYIVWYSQKGFPAGVLGKMMKEIYEIKLNGLEYLFKPFRNLKQK